MPVDAWEWLSLIDHDGPFLSRAALKSFYPSGLPRPSADEAGDVFADEFVRWFSSWSAPAEVYGGARDRWVTVVLRRLLDWSDDLQLAPAALSAESPNSAVVVKPWAVLTSDSGPLALVTLVDRTNDLRAAGTDGWSANAIDRMAVLLRETGITIGIVTDGRWWGLVSAAKDVTTASGVWDALLWREERASRDAFLALAGYASIAGGAPEKRLPLVFAKSVASAEEITEALGDQVRRAVELVLQSMSDTHLRAVSEGESSPLPEDPKAAYEGAVTVLMRIVFLLFAEERGLLPEHDLYRSSYAIAGLRQLLQQDATATSLEALDHSWEAWHRLLAASNAVFGGASFQDMRMPAYGGSLFDPSRFPWLYATDSQGRLRVRLTDRAMLAVLRAVQTIENGAMQLSFRDLDVEQIGYVYEGLLGYSAAYVTDVTIGLAGKSGFEPEIALAELEKIRDEAPTPTDFAERLIGQLKKTQEQSKPRTANQIAKAYGVDDPAAVADARTRLRYALLGDDALAARLEPFHGLIRADLRGFPYVVPAGGLVMTESPQRANTGTHYTPRALAEEVVLHALEPLVYRPGPLDTENRTEWKLRSSSEILDLKIADIAAGSGAFLVAAARYLADRLIEARAKEGLDVSHESDLKRWAVREVVARCLYGADINGMAVEMCKLSLWLISMDAGKPFSFVDDRVFHGNSLLGVISEEQLKAQHIHPERRYGREQLLWFDVDKDLNGAARIRRELASGQVDDADRMRSTKAKHALLNQADQLTAKLRDVADGIVAAGLLEGGKPGRRLDNRYDDLADALRAAYPAEEEFTFDRAALDKIIKAGLTPTVSTGEARWKPLHWVLEVPDVIHAGSGFDAIIGNPPFLGGQKLTSAMGVNIRDWLIAVVAGGSRGSADLVAYFLRRVSDLIRPGGTFGLIATNSVAQGATRDVGLAALVDGGTEIYRSVRSSPWPSRSANLEFAAVWAANNRVVHSPRIADGSTTSRIGSLLEPTGRVIGEPIRLAQNIGRTYQGSIVLGAGFVLSPEEAARMIEADARNAEVIQPYLNGEDLNSRPNRDAARWVINFKTMSEVEAASYPEPFARISDLVRPVRQRRNEAGEFVLRKPLPDRWWQYAEKRPALYAAIQSLERVIVMAQVSATLAPAFVTPRQVLDAKLVVFPSAEASDFAVLCSTVHRSFAVRYGTTMRTDATYTPKTVYLPFPRPASNDRLSELGERFSAYRDEVMLERQIGLTALYAEIASSSSDDDLVRLRDLQIDIDTSVLAALGWSDLSPEHGVFQERGRMRFMMDPATTSEVLDRLLEENHRRAKLETEAASAKKSKRDDNLEESPAPEGAMF
ncbi:Eco57I restriction-modification methylase domain-containing protein [Microbacterium sp. 179-I 3D4 NHS]|uniref:Eco57I restriction-modification methylase domain-containing protein n=1 Tax=Microbacterium sp. 179-I 3D4 NHS TaxID=3142381 RepID=UPI0039A28BD4